MDQDVDGEDKPIWESSFGTNRMADTNADGDSDGSDYLLWQINFGGSVTSPLALPVPEPPAIWFSIAFAVYLGSLRVRRKNL